MGMDSHKGAIFFSTRITEVVHATVVSLLLRHHWLLQMMTQHEQPKGTRDAC